MLIKTPQQYVNQPELLKSAGLYIAKLGKTALVIGGKTALTVVGDEFFASLKAADLNYQVEVYQGYCTRPALEHYTIVAQQSEAEIIVGVGGGKVLDLVKAVGETTGLPVVAVPTIAATCAAWSALSVFYDETGRFTEGLILKNSPQLVLVDPRIIVAAPLRYLRAGIADTLAKWYELSPYAVAGEPDLTLKIGLQQAKLAFDLLNAYRAQAIADAAARRITPVFRETVDAIIVLAGLVGSIIEGAYHPALGHAIHNSLSYLEATHQSLHGEKVIFGVLVQLLLEGKTAAEIKVVLDDFNELELPVTLRQLGIQEDGNETAAEVARGVKVDAPYAFPVTVPLLEQAIIKADQVGTLSRYSEIGALA